MRVLIAGISIATLAALHQVVLESVPTNDDFSHLALSRQLVGGDLPLRDFVDSGITLTYGLSAAAQMLFGHRLLSEAIVIALAFFISTYLVFALVRRLTGSTLAAAAAAMLLVLAGPRGYAYPKIIVYSVAAALWWRYVLEPSRPAAIALGAWVAMAFYWRPDHGMYVATGVVLAMLAAHGLRLPAVTRSLLSGATAIALVLPQFVFVASTRGVVSYVREGFAEGRTHHTVMDAHAWPRRPLHVLADVVQFAPAERFAPVVSLRWAEGATPETRQAVVARHHLAAVAADGDTTRVRLTDTGRDSIRALINDPAVADTAGVDRSSESLPLLDWPPWNRWRFRYSWLRLRLFAGLDQQRDAAEAAATLFYVLPALALIVLAPLRRRLAVPVTVTAVVAFSAFAVVVNVGVLRTGYDTRAVEAVVMPAILLGCVAGVGLTIAIAGGMTRRLVMGGAVAILVLFSMKAVGVSGQFRDRVDWLAGDWRSAARMRGAWSDMARRLAASPPLRYWEEAAEEAEAPPSIRLAQYVNACVPASERLAVLWFAPEIYYYSDRLMALRHLVFVPGLASPDEQRLTSEKFNRFSPPVVLAPSQPWTYTRTVFPDLVTFVERDYIQAGTLDEDGGYLVLVRRGRTAAGTWGPRPWPCFR